jgi:hypothetical protein
MGYMNTQEFLGEFKKLTEDMYEVAKKKNADYTGDSSSPFKNFTMVETMGAATTEQGFFTRMMDKLMRFAGFIKNGTLAVSDEKIEDTLLDLANYCLLCICYLRSKRQSGVIHTNTSTSGEIKYN